MKKYIMTIVALLMAMILTACDEKLEVQQVQDVSTKQAEPNEPTQEELNAKLKEEAVEHEYISLFRDEVSKGSKIKFTGEVFVIIKEGLFGEFGLMQTLDDGTEAVLTVINYNTADPIEIEVGKTLTVYGIYDGKNEIGAPVINATVIE